MSLTGDIIKLTTLWDERGGRREDGEEGGRRGGRKKRREEEEEGGRRGKRKGGQGITSVEHHNVDDVYVIVTYRLVCPGK